MARPPQFYGPATNEQGATNKPLPRVFTVGAALQMVATASTYATHGLLTIGKSESPRHRQISASVDFRMPLHAV